MLKVFEMFAGYGGASFALKKAGIPFETVGYSEIDKFAIQCYNQNHGDIKNFGDCTKIVPEELPDFDLLTGGFPCQAFSVAGKGLGEQDTRGTLFHDIIRIAEAKKPKYMLLENVKGLLSKRHKDTFEKILSELNRIGYNVKWKVLNSKEHGIPQNRERVFFACFKKGDLKEELKDAWFFFPEKEELKIFLKDILEDDVDEKYYLTEKQLKNILSKKHTFHSRRFQKEVCGTLLARDYKDPKLIYIKNATKKGYLEALPGDGVNLDFPTSNTRRGRVLKGCIGALQCNDGRGVATSDLWVRKLTSTECFRLMGFLDDKINLEGLSNTQRYKLAGNGWDINLVSKIFENMQLKQGVKK
jgi:DNA (cytosine-5)-methyltransferase 1